MASKDINMGKEKPNQYYLQWSIIVVVNLRDHNNERNKKPVIT